MCQSLGIFQYEWIYSESGHGKGPADGVGAAIKRRADEFVAHGGTISNAEDICNLLVTSKRRLLCRGRHIKCLNERLDAFRVAHVY
jgi:hypothetical protein